MDEENTVRRRRTFRWPKEARELVRIHLTAQRAQLRGRDSGHELRGLVTKLVEVSGNPEMPAGALRAIQVLAASVHIANGLNGHNRGCWT